MCYRGQQGCPIMGPLFCLTRQRMIEAARRNSSRGTPNFEPAFADDAFSRGDVGGVWASFQQELSLAEKYGLHIDPSKCNLYHRGDVFWFQALGVKIVSTTDAMMSKGSLLVRNSQSKNRRFPRVMQTVIPTGTYNKIQYWCRTRPRQVLAPLLHNINDCQKHFLEQVIRKPLTPLQWTQAKLPTKAGGFGLMSPRLELGLDIVHLADLSFLASLKKCRLGVQALLPLFPCPQLQHLETSAIQHITNNFPNSPPPFKTPKRT